MSRKDPRDKIAKVPLGYPEPEKDSLAPQGPASYAEKHAEAEAIVQTIDPDIAAVDEMISAGQIASIALEDGEFIWTGEPEWPVFIGWPYLQNLGQMPWPMELVREDAATHCKIYVRTDV